ncbi:2-phosphosulfolactate phosphatase [Bacteroidota bacterium]
MNEPKDKKTIEVCFTPKLFPFIMTEDNFIVVIVDILRATTSICVALDHGVKSMIPVASVDEARNYKNQGFLVASERDGKVLDFADFGNSAFNFMGEGVKGKTIVYSTTNGTKAIEMAKDSEKVVIGSFINLSALASWLIAQERNVVILCAGWKGKFNLEDSVFAGALAEKLLENENFITDCDSTKASVDLWNISRNDILKYIEKASHRTRLRNLVLDDVMEYSFTLDISRVIPALENGHIVDIS